MRGRRSMLTHGTRPDVTLDQVLALGPGIRQNRSSSGYVRSFATGEETSPPRDASLKGGDPAAGSPTATLLRLHPSH